MLTNLILSTQMDNFSIVGKNGLHRTQYVRMCHVLLLLLQVPSEHQLVGVALHPAQESTALHTLLETALRSSPDSTHLLLGPVGDCNDAPPSTPPQGSPISGRADISTDSPLPSPPLFTPSQVRVPDSQTVKCSRRPPLVTSSRNCTRHLHCRCYDKKA